MALGTGHLAVREPGAAIPIGQRRCFFGWHDRSVHLQNIQLKGLCTRSAIMFGNKCHSFLSLIPSLTFHLILNTEPLGKARVLPHNWIS